MYDIERDVKSPPANQEQINLLKVFKMILIHDLVEAEELIENGIKGE